MAIQQIHNEATEGQAVGYVRLSKYDGGSRSEATLRQEGNIRDSAERWGDEIVTVYVDDDRSASEDEHGFIKPRDDFNRMQAEIASGVVPAKVYYYAHDRFLRNVEEGEHVRRWARKHKVELVCCVSGGPVDLKDENGVFQFQLNTILGRRETAATSRRIKEMFERTVIVNGTSLGGMAPFGYLKVGAKGKDENGNQVDTRRFEIIPEEAEVVTEIIERVAAGQTLTRIADDLNKGSIMPRRVAADGTRREAKNGWSLTAVRTIAMNGRYAGRMMHKGIDRGASAYPAIVDESTWRQAVAVLSDPKRMKRRAARKYLLSGGVLICGKCGLRLTSRPHYGRKEITTKYACVTAKGCAGVTIAAPDVERLITTWVIEHIESKEFAADLRRVMSKTPQVATTVAEIEHRRDQVSKQYSMGRMSDKAYNERMDELSDQIAHLQATVSNDTAVAAVGRYAGRKGKLQAAWDDEEQPMSLDRKQAIIRAVLDHVVIAPVGRGGNVFDPGRVGDPVWR
jgi:DNA invertase Pin-like site-specific DNA recombinase